MFTCCFSVCAGEWEVEASRHFVATIDVSQNVSSHHNDSLVLSLSKGSSFASAPFSVSKVCVCPHYGSTPAGSAFQETPSCSSNSLACPPLPGCKFRPCSWRTNRGVLPSPVLWWRPRVSFSHRRACYWRPRVSFCIGRHMLSRIHSLPDTKINILPGRNTTHANTTQAIKENALAHTHARAHIHNDSNVKHLLLSFSWRPCSFNNTRQ